MGMLTLPIITASCDTPSTWLFFASSVRSVGSFSMVFAPRSVTMMRFSFPKPSDLLLT